MREKSFLGFIVILFIFCVKANADVIFPVYSADKFVASTSLEKIFSYEKQLGTFFL